MMTLNDLITGTKGELFCGDTQLIQGVCTNSKEENMRGKVFIPLKGDNHDAHKFVGDVLEAGVSAVVFHQFNEEWKKFEDRCAFVKVSDTLKALQDLAHFWRKKFSIPVIAVTGSNGKTTTKDFTFQILSQSGKTCASDGSYNNHWGVPLTLLKMRDHDRFAVVEMGMNHSGEITALNAIAEPSVVVVTTVGKAHMGFFKDISGIAQAKEEIYKSAPSGAKMIFNLDNEWTKKMSAHYSAHSVYSLKEASADVFLKVIEKTAKGFKLAGHINKVEGEAEVLFWGEHNIENLMAAISLSSAAGVSEDMIWQALSKCNTGWGRNQWVELESGGQVLFDAYNANPDSFATLIKNLGATLQSFKNKMAVVGEMLELGDQSSSEHEKLGQRMASLDWDSVFFIGPSASAFQRGWEAVGNKKNLVISNTYEEFLEKDMESMLNPQTLLVIKGSRGQRLERVVEMLKPRNFSV